MRLDTPIARRAAFALAALMLSACAIGPALAAPPRATRVVVDKSDRALYVYVGQSIVATYPVGLGVNHRGHKQQEGDRRTPEGQYVLDYKNAGSAFFRSIHVSYPNADDVRRARARGVAPGGAIMIHGQPNDPALRERVRRYPFPDWTDGCIALSDAHMRALWDLVDVPVPILIRP